jgi:hypothetical protein
LRSSIESIKFELGNWQRLLLKNEAKTKQLVGVLSNFDTNNSTGIRRGVSKGVEDGCRLPALLAGNP